METAELHRRMGELCDSPFLGEILRQIVLARAMHPPINSLHEGYAVLAEEVEEFWEEVRKKSADRDYHNARLELAQVCAVAWRIVHDVLYEGAP